MLARQLWKATYSCRIGLTATNLLPRLHASYPHVDIADSRDPVASTSWFKSMCSLALDDYSNNVDLGTRRLLTPETWYIDKAFCLANTFVLKVRVLHNPLVRPLNTLTRSRALPRLDEATFVDGGEEHDRRSRI